LTKSVLPTQAAVRVFNDVVKDFVIEMVEHSELDDIAYDEFRN